MILVDLVSPVTNAEVVHQGLALLLGLQESGLFLLPLLLRELSFLVVFDRIALEVIVLLLVQVSRLFLQQIELLSSLLFALPQVNLTIMKVNFVGDPLERSLFLLALRHLPYV